MQHPTLPDEGLGFVPAWGTPLSRVQTRLMGGLLPIHMRYDTSVGVVVGAHSAGVQIDTGTYQGRHRAAEVNAA